MSDYNDLIKKLDDLKDRCLDEDEEYLQEAMDIISDYEKVVESATRMSQHYETAAKPIRKNEIWVCPECGKRIAYHHSFCHFCGKKIDWDFR